jgi:hypothetical protein
MKKAKQQQIHPPSRDRATAIAVAVVLLLVFLSAAILANSMTKPVSRDEHMYCTAGALLAQGQLPYRDFSYPSQLPYHPLLLAALYKTFATTHYLLVARLLSVVSDILVLISIIGIFRFVFARHRKPGLLLGAAAAILYAFNPLVDYAAGYAWNHDAVIACVVASLWLLIATDFQAKSRYWRVALIGALLTFATAMRVTTALVEVVFLLAILLMAGRSLRNRLATALPFSAAALLVLIWPLSVLMRAPEAFWLNLTRLPALYGRWLHQTGIVHTKPALTIASLTQPGYAALLAAAAYLTWTLARNWSNLKPEAKSRALLAALLPLIFFVIAYIPPTMWRQYLAMPVPFFAIALAYPLAHLHRVAKPRSNRSFTIAGAVVGICAALAVVSNLTVLTRSLAVLVPEHWEPTKLHKVATDIAAETPGARRTLTLGPLFALEGGGDIYPELASGAVVYRAADALSDHERAVTHTVGPATLAALVEQSPPAIVIVGAEPSYFSFLEDPLREVVNASWRRDTDTGLIVYRRP